MNGKSAAAVVKQAQSWIGCKESNGSHKVIIDTYNTGRPVGAYKMSYTDPWCSCFVSAVAMKCGCTDIIPVEVGCQRHIDLFKKLGEWVEDDAYVPKPGDIVFYDWDDNGTGDNIGWSDHVGIVEKVSGNQITVIEGNYSDAVGRRTLNVNAKYIRGYGVPKYDKDSIQAPAKESAKETAKLDAAEIEAVARDVIKGKYGNGLARMQALKAAGYDYDVVQAKVNELWKK